MLAPFQRFTNAIKQLWLITLIMSLGSQLAQADDYCEGIIYSCTSAFWADNARWVFCLFDKAPHGKAQLCNQTEYNEILIEPLEAIAQRNPAEGAVGKVLPTDCDGLGSMLEELNSSCWRVVLATLENYCPYEMGYGTPEIDQIEDEAKEIVTAFENACLQPADNTGLIVVASVVATILFVAAAFYVASKRNKGVFNCWSFNNREGGHSDGARLA